MALELLKLEGPFTFTHTKSGDTCTWGTEGAVLDGLSSALAPHSYGWHYTLSFSFEEQRYRKYFLAMTLVDEGQDARDFLLGGWKHERECEWVKEV